MKLQVFCLISSLVVPTIALPNSFARSDLDKPELADRASSDALERNDGHFVTHRGMIGVTAANGTSLGFISRVLSDFGTYVADSEESVAAIFSFSAKKFGKSDGLLLKEDTCDCKISPYLGGVIPHGYDLAKAQDHRKRKGSAGSAKGSGTAKSGKNKPPKRASNSYNAKGNGAGRRSIETRNNPTGGDIESAIWTFDPSTNKLFAIWTNSDFSSSRITLHYDTCDPPGLNLVADNNGFGFSNPEAFEIALHFIPQHRGED